MTTFDKDRLTRIDDWMDGYVAKGRFPGASMLLAQGGEIAHRYTTGMRDVEKGLPWFDDTIVRVFSMTKPITSVALMTLVERGLFHLDAPLSEFIPEFADMTALAPGADSIDQVERCATPTIAQAATHTSGLSYSFNPTPLSKRYHELKQDFGPTGGTLEAMAAQAGSLPLAFKPGERWHYSIGIDILGRVIEVVSGKTLDVFFKEEIFDPLGMDETSFTIADKHLDRFASLYTSLEGDPMALGSAHSGGMRKVDEPETSPFRETTNFSGGGGLLAPMDDYFKFADMVRRGGERDGERILSPSTLKFMRQNFLPGDIASMGTKSFAEMPMEGMGFGVGWAVAEEPSRTRMPGSVGDHGWGGMASTYWWNDPVRDLTCIFYTQLTPSSSYPNRAQLKALVHGAMTGA
ncbi:MAG: serine hydrolase domain-containing protein [Pseudomonadota bacterium]